MKHFVCIDIGGTAIKYGVIDEALHISHTDTVSTPTSGKEDILNTLKEIVSSRLQLYPDAEGICISSAGIINSDEGYVLDANEDLMPGYTGAKLRGVLSEAFYLPCSVENDVNCAALAEYHAGAAKGFRSSLTLTVGTGIGGAFVSDGKLLKGHSYSACEVGYMHMMQPVMAGNTASFEQLGATSVLVSRTAARLGLAPGSIDGKWIFAEAAAGNTVCQTAIQEMCSVLSMGIANLCYVLNPEVVVIGGGISSQESVLRPLIEEGLEAYLIPSIREKTSLAFAHHKNNAGMIGAYLAYRAR